MTANLRSRHISQSLNLPAINGNPGYFQQILAGGLIPFSRGRARSQANQRRGKAVDQAQRLVQWGAPPLRVLIVKVVSPQVDAAKNALHLEGAIGMTLFTGAAGVVWNVQGSGIKQPFQQTATVLEQRLTQPHLYGFEVAHSLASKTFPDQPQERLRLAELFFPDFGRLEFFLASGSPSAICVIWSVMVMH